ncbi:hypothetical protein J8J42_11570 [Chryseobacterium sp. cx-311]|uniref:hypothetical protein n=1 Tax=Marnyiella aurantia TaxID=2758037 RepID=UPI001AE5DB1F|nr:hypothetical protein [Marnyiella aurantia]MBP0613677.1 hypothetical protein [Marnyiella aurantia]
MKEVKLQAFIDWLINNDYVSRDSAISYDSYVRNACRLVNIALEQINTLEEVEDIVNYLSQPNVGLLKNKSQKTLTNYKSGLRMYAEFLNDIDSSIVATPENFQETTDATALLHIGNTVYDKKELYKTFNLRLTTQDRFYEEIYFPISVIKQLLYKNGEREFYDAFLKNLLDATQIHCSERIFTLKEVSELAIENGKVEVVINRVKQVVFTPNPAGNLEPFNVANLKSVSLDHLYSQYTIMHDLKTSLPMFNQLTSLLKQANPITNRTALSAYKKLHGIETLRSAVDLKELKRELLLIADKTQLQLMDRSMNTSKGKM